MNGGPSQVDTFDPKPLLTQYHGRNPGELFEVAPTQFNNNGTLMGSPWKFDKHGQSGIEISSLFQNIAKHADKLAVVRSMTSKFPEHTSANYFLHTGHGLQGRPSMGAWVTYGLGSECQDLPGYIVLNGGLIPPGGLDCFGNGFLPATYQGSVLRPSGNSLANVRRIEPTPELQKHKLDLLRQRMVILAVGEGRYERPQNSWKMGQALGGKGVPNRVDFWGPEHDHDWMTWREQLPQYLDHHCP
jgi:hypothetical protein